MNRVLVPILGLPEEEGALSVVQAIADRTDARIELLHVHERMNGTIMPSDAALERAQSRLSEIAQQFTRPQEVDVHIAYGPPVDRIIERAAEDNSTLIVISPRWSEELTGFAPDSVSRQLIASVRTPLLLVPDRMDTPSRSVRNVLVSTPGAVDGSTELEHLAEWLLPLDPLVRLVAILPSESHEGSLNGDGAAHRSAEELLLRTQANLHSARAQFLRHGIRCTWEVRYGQAVHELPRVIETIETDLIALCSPPAQASPADEIGTAAIQVAHEAKLPVLIFPDPNTAARISGTALAFEGAM